MVQVDPSQFQLLLVGARVCQLKPFLEARGLKAAAAASGLMGRRWLSTTPPDLVLLELNLDDTQPAEFVQAAKEQAPHAGFILVEDRDRAGQVARALEFGVDAYLSTPPDETRLFDTIFRQLNAVAMRKSVTADEADLQARLQEAHETIAQLQMLVRHAPDDDAGDANTASLDEVAAAQALATDQVAQLNAQLGTEGAFADALAVVAEQQSRVAALEAELAAKEQQLADATAAAGDAAAAEHQTTALQSELDAVQQKLQRAEQDLQQKEQVQLESQQRLVALEQSLMQTQTRVADVEREKEAAVKAAKEEAQAALQAERQTLQQQQSDVERLQEEAENRLLTMDVEIDEYKEEIAALKDEVAEKDRQVREERRLRVEERESMLAERR